MRALECECGEHIEAVNDEELRIRLREHLNYYHQQGEISDEDLERIIAERAYDV
ncbi:hypothetical protein Tter_1771 [Thermobaculum terrenum ATCC BAA-798]|uniref:DUF1059 domain-containing protein n=2 Tax=Thermobaculum TaxID=262406 RepID=D1CD12_THET1|nr:hypothetical protein Tter_1771 [Thermobaculum terrenum ATCC BAA-798]